MARIALVSHDAGGAELVTNWARHQENIENEYLCSAKGPAIDIFARNLSGFTNMPMTEVVSSADWLLSATSWQSDHEKIAIKLALDLKKHTAVYLDHWSNYKERLHVHGKQLNPKEIWVSDNYAFSIASRIFKKNKIILKDNAYLQKIKQEIITVQKDIYQQYGEAAKHEGARILYVAENIDEHALRSYGDHRHWGYDEKDAFRFFLDNIERIQSNIASISIRQHPSQSKNTYDWAKNESQLIVSTYSTKSLVDDIVASDIVVGVESMAMVVGLIAGKKVLSCKPAGVEKCVLPHKEIIHIRDLVDINL